MPAKLAKTASPLAGGELLAAISNSIVADCFERIGVTAAKLTEQAVIAEQQAGPPT